MKAAAVVITLLPSLAPADISAFLGTWCGQDDPLAMHVESRGIGFNEHTVCEWKTGPVVDTDGFTGVLTCHNVYVTGQDDSGAFLTVETDHRRGLEISTGVVRVDSYGARIMEVMVSDWPAPVEFGPCG